MRMRWFFGFVLVTSGTALALPACGDDDANIAEVPDGGMVDGASSSTSPVDSSADGSISDAGDASVIPNTGPTTFTVPAGGGAIIVLAQTMTVTFAFPASAAGKAIKLSVGAYGRHRVRPDRSAT